MPTVLERHSLGIENPGIGDLKAIDARKGEQCCPHPSRVTTEAREHHIGGIAPDQKFVKIPRDGVQKRRTRLREATPENDDRRVKKQSDCC